MSHLEHVYQVCCRYKNRYVYIHTRSGRVYYGQLVDVDRRNVYLQMASGPRLASGHRGEVQVMQALGEQAPVVVEPVLWGPGIAVLSLYSILAIALAPWGGGFGYGYYRFY